MRVVAAVTTHGGLDGALQDEYFYRLAAEASDGVYSAEDMRRMSEAWLLGEYPGVDTVFDRLEPAGVDTALLSNTNDAHWRRLVDDASDSPEFPNVRRAGRRYASHLLRLAKPDRRIYEAVAMDSGHQPSRILFFDDGEANVSGARDAGWTAELIDHAGDTAAQLLDALRRFALID